ncbi:chloride channel protein [Halalkalibacter wakoensis JCM 9140]|uniref:Chloride channel protein n=1 Tax=Halalkalibacter wakoensis JCM 9140 TaxID=1236970 RepID=W4Q2S3_9BACI|nr:chloride channel protein [Halalkalibacter wakoensis]GAE25664.1 chloride channel protein [Halalkalibacter wakoensis JCM 9140]
MNDKPPYKTLLVTLFIWVTIAGVIGLTIGSTTALLLHTNDFLGLTRKENSWLIFLLPLAGMAIGFLYMQAGEKSGNELYKGNNLVIEGVQGKKTMIRRLGPLVYVGTFLTVLFGGSTGREGAAIQMGGSVAETVIRFCKINAVDTKLLLMSGISAGFGTAFGAPIAGAVFGMEMTALGKLKYEAIVPCLVSSIVGHYTAEKLWGVKHESFIIETVPTMSFLTVSKVILLAILFSFLSVLYCQVRHGIQKYSEKITKKNHVLRAFAGGMIIVALTMIIGTVQYNGRGIEMLEQAFHEEVPAFAFLFKLVFTAVTLGTGFVGGEAIPLFFMGATLGNSLYGFVDLPLSFLAALGMIATFVGGANTPIAAFLLAIEMFDGKAIEFFFLACVTSYIFSGHHGLWPSQTIYEPKSRLYKIPTGKTVASIEKKKEE